MKFKQVIEILQAKCLVGGSIVFDPRTFNLPQDLKLCPGEVPGVSPVMKSLKSGLVTILCF